MVTYRGRRGASPSCAESYQVRGAGGRLDDASGASGGASLREGVEPSGKRIEREVLFICKNNVNESY